METKLLIPPLTIGEKTDSKELIVRPEYEIVDFDEQRRWFLKFIIISSFSLLFLTTRVYSLSCTEQCNVYGGASSYVIGKITYTWNPLIGEFVKFGGIVATPYVCGYICEERGRWLCVDKDKYTGSGSATRKDPYECIVDNGDPSKVYIKDGCNGAYTVNQIETIIAADDAFYDCTDEHEGI
ncbi:hypothetical protein [Halarcobacter sp.]|uniref:hypothetical protein n=1 Tax=Halarcobacter sp. TaxID=2321133 RepID=UPI002AABEA5F|nr:hypothetical protein [Halarcobacter sp.]